MLINTLYVKKNKQNIIIIVLLLLFSGILQNTSEAQTSIIGDPTYTNVTMTAPGNYDISSVNPAFSDSSGSSILYNHYTNFSLDAGDIANILLNGANTSINYVSAGMGTFISGILNSRIGLSGSPIGGNLVFIDPSGIMLMPGGQINAGSILLSASSSTIVPLNPGAFSEADLNNPAHYSRLVTQTMSTNGTVQFIAPPGGIVVAGDINSNPTSSADIFNSIEGVFMFGNYISVSGTITVPTGHSIQGYTDNNMQWDMTEGIAELTSPFANGSFFGSIWLDGTLTAPGGYMNFEVNTLDNMTNFINIDGVLDATAIVSGGHGGDILLSTNQPGGIITFDSFPSGHGYISASGLDTGYGGNVLIESTQVQLLNSSFIDALNGVNSEVGGTVLLASTSGSTSSTSIGIARFIEPSSISKIFVANLASEPDAEGELYFLENTSTPGVSIHDPVTFPDGASIYLVAFTGDINVDTLGMGIVNSFRDIFFLGNTINLNANINSTLGDITAASINGQVNVGLNTNLTSGASGDIIFTRTESYGPLTVNAEGTLNSGAGLSTIIIGNEGTLDFVQGQITLTGPTFGPHAGTYDESTLITLNPATTPNIFASELQVVLDSHPTPGPTPDPSTDTSSPVHYSVSPTNKDSNTVKEEEPFIISAAETINSDLIDTEQRWQDFNTLESDIQNLEDTSNSGTYVSSSNRSSKYNQKQTADVLNKFLDESSDIALKDLALTSAFNMCSIKGELCNPFLNNSVGNALVDLLLTGYPFEKEFMADMEGLNYSYQCGYHPQGLVGFLITIKNIEKMLPAQSNVNANSLLNYKHPETKTRINKLQTVIEHQKMISKNKLVNSTKLKKITKKIEIND